MRNGHKGRMACGILELMLGVGLILSTMYVLTSKTEIKVGIFQ